jgi:hypothetical protein
MPSSLGGARTEKSQDHLGVRPLATCLLALLAEELIPLCSPPWVEEAQQGTYHSVP